MKGTWVRVCGCSLASFALGMFLFSHPKERATAKPSLLTNATNAAFPLANVFGPPGELQPANNEATDFLTDRYRPRLLAGADHYQNTLGNVSWVGIETLP